MAKPKAFDPIRVPVRPAATLMLLDDRPQLEVLLLRRRKESDFVPGMYVFPGGGVDAEDADAEIFCRGLEGIEANARLGLAGGGLAYWVAAIRETLEESGVLLAASAGSELPLDFNEAAVVSRVERMRHAVDDGDQTLAEAAKSESLVFPLHAIHYVSRWITPLGSPRRYDTRFFVAGMPEGQHASHDDGEAVDSIWIRPEAALAEIASGAWSMLPPTVGMLRILASYSTTAEVLTAAARHPTGPDVPAKLGGTGQDWRVLFAGDEGYEEASQEALQAWVRLPEVSPPKA